MRIVDLTLPIIEGHWRYDYHEEPRYQHANHDPWQNVSFNLESHWFTHIDFPLHFDPNGETSDDYPIEDWAITKCLVLDLTDAGPSQAITGDMLEKANEAHKDEHFDSILIRTDLGKRVDWTTRDFWNTSPYVDESGGIWIQNYAPKVVGYDFPQDYEIRNIPNKKRGDPIPQPVHEHVLKQGKILQIEYINYLWEIGADVCTLIALPLKRTHADGLQIRVVAVVDD